MNNVVNNPKTLSRLWAALSCDFEALLARFMSSKGWRYGHFSRICHQMQITLILHITQGRGKAKDEHYFRITDMILQMCKDLWLRAFEATDRPDTRKSNADISMELKRALGGFYLLYTMYEKQPIPDRVKISLGICDMIAFNKFCTDVRVIPWSAEVIFMLQYLDIKQAFLHCIFADEYRFDASTRNFMNVSRSDVVTLTRRIRDNQDVLAYSSVHNQSEREFAELTRLKQDVARDILRTVNPASRQKHLRYESAFRLFVRTVVGDSLQQTMGKLDKLLDKPVMTLQGLTATEAVDRRIMMETRKRMERARKKALQAVDREGEKVVRPYVREGGIFGRKKETQEGDDKTKRRERGACNGNLWVYINGLDFDKPLGKQREEDEEEEIGMDDQAMEVDEEDAEDDPLAED